MSGPVTIAYSGPGGGSYPTQQPVTPAKPLPVVTPGANYKTVAANLGPVVLGPTGAVGDILTSVLVIPATTAPGAVTITDGATNTVIFIGGAVVDLTPFSIPLGIASTTGPWKITTGANVSVLANGRFT